MLMYDGLHGHNQKACVSPIFSLETRGSLQTGRLGGAGAASLLSLHREMSSKATCQLAGEARGEGTGEISPFNLQEVEAGGGNVSVTITSAGRQF